MLGPFQDVTSMHPLLMTHQSKRACVDPDIKIFAFDAPFALHQIFFVDSSKDLLDHDVERGIIYFAIPPCSDVRCSPFDECHDNMKPATHEEVSNQLATYENIFFFV